MGTESGMVGRDKAMRGRAGSREVIHKRLGDRKKFVFNI